MEIKRAKFEERKMVGTTRFELATSPTPRVRSTRLSHVPTCCIGRSHKEAGAAGVSSVYTTPIVRLAVVRSSSGAFPPDCFLAAKRPRRLLQWVGATYSLGSSPPEPKKNSFICSTKNS